MVIDAGRTSGHGRLQGTVALVTGAMRGIGRAIAERFAAEGCNVIATDVLDENEARPTFGELGERGFYLKLDVTSEKDWSAAQATVEQEFGMLDILVNNAGIDWIKRLADLSLKEWRRVMAVNSDGVFLGTRTMTDLLAAAGAMRHGGASIVNISSVMGYVGFPNTSAYNASKGAVRVFTKACAVEFGASGLAIRVNAIHPGFIVTAILRDGFEKIAADMNAAGLGPVTAAELTAKGAALHPIGRLGEPEEVANAALFLASTESSFMTGSDLVVDGGYMAQ